LKNQPKNSSRRTTM